MQINSQRKKINLFFRKLKTQKILQLANLQSASSAKKKIGQMSASIYKQNVTTIIMLAILPSFVRKSHLQGLARQKTLLHILKASPLMLINHYIDCRYFALLQTSITSYLLKKLS